MLKPAEEQRRDPLRTPAEPQDSAAPVKQKKGKKTLLSWQN